MPPHELRTGVVSLREFRTVGYVNSNCGDAPWSGEDGGRGLLEVFTRATSKFNVRGALPTPRSYLRHSCQVFR